MRNNILMVTAACLITTVSPAFAGESPGCLPKCRLAADTYVVHPGEAATLSWISMNAGQVTIRDNRGTLEKTITIDPLTPNQWSSDQIKVTYDDKIKEQTTYTYTMSVSGTGGCNNCPSIDVTVVPNLPPVANLKASTDTVNLDDKVKLTWSSENADKCDVMTEDNRVVVSQGGPSGEIDDMPGRYTKYRAVCSNKYKSAQSALVPVKVKLSIDVKFTTNNGSLEKEVKNKAQNDAEMKKLAGKIATQFVKDPNLKVIITGHTDNVWTACADNDFDCKWEKNLALSSKRLESIRTTLIRKHGVPASVLSTTHAYSFGHPDTCPEARYGKEEALKNISIINDCNSTDEKRQQNRRSEAEFESAGI